MYSSPGRKQLESTFAVIYRNLKMETRLRYSVYGENMLHGFETMNRISSLEKSSDELLKTLDKALFLICKKRLSLAMKRIKFQQCDKSLPTKCQRKNMAGARKMLSYGLYDSRKENVHARNENLTQSYDRLSIDSTETVQARQRNKQNIDNLKQRRAINGMDNLRVANVNKDNSHLDTTIH